MFLVLYNQWTSHPSMFRSLSVLHNMGILPQNHFYTWDQMVVPAPVPRLSLSLACLCKNKNAFSYIRQVNCLTDRSSLLYCLKRDA
jgi:hypothetical protein